MDHWCAQETMMVLMALPVIAFFKTKVQLLWSKAKVKLGW